jgi:hypothetical protein
MIPRTEKRFAQGIKNNRQFAVLALLATLLSRFATSI